MTTTESSPLTLDNVRAMTTPVVSVEEVSRLLGLDPRTVRRACENGDLPSVKVGRRVLVLREPLIAKIEAR